MRILHIKESFRPSSDDSCVSLAKEQKAAGNDVFILASVASESIEQIKDKIILHSKEDSDFEKASALKLLRIQHNNRKNDRIPRKELRDVLNTIRPDQVYIHGELSKAAMWTIRCFQRRCKFELYEQR